MNMDPYAIRKVVDVKRLKNQLWDELKPKINSLNERDIQDVQMSKPEDDLTMSDLMNDMYYNSHKVDPDQVSVQSAFICLLHLANEKGISFDNLEQDVVERDFKIDVKSDIIEEKN